MRWFVTGSEGQLGVALRRSLAAAGEPHSGKDLELDIADTAAVAAELDALGEAPDVLVNAAAYTHVDRCEEQPALAARVNADAPAGLAALCQERGMRFVHVSTDYVFSGDATEPYPVDAPAAPQSVYGRTKWDGECRVREACPDALLVRTSWVYGKGRNFIGAILGQAEKIRASGEGELKVVGDQLGRPTYAADLAEAIHILAREGRGGTFHFANDGEATWWDLAREALDLSGFGETPVERIVTESLNLPAARPAYSVLDISTARDAGVPIRPWQQALAAYLESDDAKAALAT